MEQYKVIIENATNHQPINPYTKVFDDPANAEKYFVDLLENESLNGLALDLKIVKSSVNKVLKHASFAAIAAE